VNQAILAWFTSTRELIMFEILLFLILQVSIILSDVDSYIGAVVEYAPVNSYERSSPMEVLAENVDRYLEYMEEAKRLGGDIIVFPEYGVSGSAVSEAEDREAAREFMVVGEVGRNYCAGEYVNNNDELMEMIGCGARDNNIYVLVNIGEMVNCTEAQIECNHEDGYNSYNTNLVFDRSGNLVAKYWKQNLFFEPVFDVPAEPVFTSFTSDFGVSFGTFTCFDVVWEHSVQLLAQFPNVTDILFPTSWVDELPYFLAPEVQLSFAVTNEVNFLASGRHAPERMALGSGIYTPTGPLNYTYDSNSGSKLVIAEIPIKKSETPKIRKINNPTEIEFGQITATFENISFYTKIEMTKGQHENVQLCHNETFCCEAAYTISNEHSDTRYVLLAFDGLRPLDIVGQHMPIQMCGVVMCAPNNGDDCKIPNFGECEGETILLSLTSKDFNANSLVFPTSITSDQQLPDWNNMKYRKSVTEYETYNETRYYFDNFSNSKMFSAALYGKIMNL